MGIEAHQVFDFVGLGSEQLQGLLDGVHQLDKIFEVAIMRCPGLNFLPKVLERLFILHLE